MKVDDLRADEKDIYFKCLEDWSEETNEAGPHKENWYNKMRPKGLRVKMAHDDKGIVGGMIQYLPIEHSIVDGEGLYFVYCIWVHGHKQGRGDFQKRGMGKALLKAAEEDARALGAKGMAAWGLSLPFFMPASWFKKQGYLKAEKDGMMVLLWKPFSKDARPPKYVKPKKSPSAVPGKVTVTSFNDGWCTSMNIVHERAKRASGELGDKVAFRTYDTTDRSTFLEWGISTALFIDDKEVQTGPPPSYEDIKKLIAKRVKKLGKEKG